MQTSFRTGLPIFYQENMNSSWSHGKIDKINFTSDEVLYKCTRSIGSTNQREYLLQGTINVALYCIGLLFEMVWGKRSLGWGSCKVNSLRLQFNIDVYETIYEQTKIG